MQINFDPVFRDITNEINKDMDERVALMTKLKEVEDRLYDRLSLLGFSDLSIANVLGADVRFGSAGNVTMKKEDETDS